MRCSGHGPSPPSRRAGRDAGGRRVRRVRRRRRAGPPPRRVGRRAPGVRGRQRPAGRAARARLDRHAAGEPRRRGRHRRGARPRRAPAPGGPCCGVGDGHLARSQGGEAAGAAGPARWGPGRGPDPRAGAGRPRVPLRPRCGGRHPGRSGRPRAPGAVAAGGLGHGPRRGPGPGLRRRPPAPRRGRRHRLRDGRGRPGPARGRRRGVAVAPRRRSSTTPVYAEVGKKRAFVSARDWPGWCRAGKDEEAALTALADYAPRYAVVAAEAGLDLPATVAEHLDVVERLPGDATTEFGAPGAVWAVFDRVAAAAPATLAKGPRGGGRDRDPIVEHVVGAEAGYARKIGIAHKAPAGADTAAVAALRTEILDAVRSRRFGAPPRSEPWPARYAIRRIAWHVLDHAWEIEDKS